MSQLYIVNNTPKQKFHYWKSPLLQHLDHYHYHMFICFCLLCCLVQEEKVAVAKAKDFLESNTYSADDPYTTALSAYALALLRSPYAPLALRRLNHMAITQGTHHCEINKWIEVHSLSLDLINLGNRCMNRWQATARCWMTVCFVIRHKKSQWMYKYKLIKYIF